MLAEHWNEQINVAYASVHGAHLHACFRAAKLVSRLGYSPRHRATVGRAAFTRAAWQATSPMRGQRSRTANAPKPSAPCKGCACQRHEACQHRPCLLHTPWSMPP